MEKIVGPDQESIGGLSFCATMHNQLSHTNQGEISFWFSLANLCVKKFVYFF